jgi:hypothetical protein
VGEASERARGPNHTPERGPVREIDLIASIADLRPVSHPRDPRISIDADYREARLEKDAYGRAADRSGRACH